MKQGPGGRRQALASLVAGLAGVLVLAGCNAISSVVNTQQALENDGYQSVSVNPGFSSDNLGVSVTVDAVPTETVAEAVAQVVWLNFHERFGSLEITVNGHGDDLVEDYTFADLQSAFGPRDPAWNRTTIGDATRRAGVEILIGAVVVGALVTVGIVVLVRRRRRLRPRPAYPGAPPVWTPAGSPGGVGSLPSSPGAPLWPAPPYPPWGYSGPPAPAPAPGPLGSGTPPAAPAAPPGPPEPAGPTEPAGPAGPPGPDDPPEAGGGSPG